MSWFAALSLGAAFVFSSPASQGGPETEWKAYDISSILRPALDGGNPALWGTRILSSARDRGSGETAPPNPFFVSRGSGPLLQPDELLGLIRNAVTPSVWSQGEGSLDVQETALLVEGPPATHQEIRSLLAELDRSLRGLEIDLRVFFFAGRKGGYPSGPLLERASVEQLLQTRARDPGAAWHVEGRVLSGSTFGMELRREQEFVQGYKVEVATKSKGVQPRISRWVAGPAVAVRPYLLSGIGKIHVTALLEKSEGRDLRRFETKALDFGAVQIPKVESWTFASSACLGTGEGLWVSWSELENAAGFLVTASAREAAAADSSFHWIDSRFVVDRTGKNLPALERDLGSRHRDPFPGPESAISPDFLAQVFRSGPEGVRDRARLFRLSTGLYLVPADSSFAPPLREALEKLQAFYVPNVRLELALLAGDSQETAAPFARTVLCATMNRSCGVIAGLESTHVSGYELQIAQESTIAEPVVRPLFEGVIFRARPTGWSAKGVRVLVDLQTNGIRSEELVRSGLQTSGDFLQVEQAYGSFVGTVDLPEPGTASWLGELERVPGIPLGKRCFATLTGRWDAP